MHESKHNQICELKKLRATILIDFSFKQYVNMTKDYNLDNVTQELFDLWYSSENISSSNSTTLTIDFNHFSREELSQMIHDDEKLKLALQREFNSLTFIP